MPRFTILEHPNGNEELIEFAGTEKQLYAVQLIEKWCGVTLEHNYETYTSKKEIHKFISKYYPTALARKTEAELTNIGARYQFASCVEDTY